MKKSNLFLVAVILLVNYWNLSAQTRGVDLEAVVGPNINVGKQWAVFIAIDRYQEWGPLNNPVRDAREIRDILTKHYYIDEIRELYDRDATNNGIRQLLVGLRNQVGRSDSVFVFFAGHGHTDHDTNTSFWIPADGQQLGRGQANWLPNIQIRNMLTQLPARHVFLAVDSCFSGDILDINRGARPNIDSDYYRRAYAKISRQVMTSGSSESVPDTSEFVMRFKSSLLRAEGACIDPEHIFINVREVKSTQPLLGIIRNSEHQEGGSFLFFKRQTAAIIIEDNTSNTLNVQQQIRPEPQIISHSVIISFDGDSFPVRDQRTVRFGIRDAMQRWNTSLTLEENTTADNVFNVTIHKELENRLIRAEVTVTFSRGGRIVCQTGPYYISESSDSLLARRITEKLRSDQEFFNRVNEIIK